ncbi:uncharacterized protein LOC111928822 [Cyanistes caeruleus]|uniref:uncharacterized protein LOC111928822 n=1 Tax=Cyanistes caeruleus TaxID=156563 RepID=UPI000CDB412B|nr:uncharacterized protein LOC111928822 [Cyanistes caeruleus]
MGEQTGRAAALCRSRWPIERPAASTMCLVAPCQNLQTSGPTPAEPGRPGAEPERGRAVPRTGADQKPAPRVPGYPASASPASSGDRGVRKSPVLELESPMEHSPVRGTESQSHHFSAAPRDKAIIGTIPTAVPDPECSRLHGSSCESDTPVLQMWTARPPKTNCPCESTLPGTINGQRNTACIQCGKTNPVTRQCRSQIHSDRSSFKDQGNARPSVKGRCAMMIRAPFRLPVRACGTSSQEGPEEQLQWVFPHPS